MRPVLRAASLLSTAAMALAGFVLLDTTKAVLWLFFLIIAYPVLMCFSSSLIDGTKFTASDLINVYRESLRALPSLFNFLRNLFRSNKG